MINTDAFADPWEQLRLLSDARRNTVLLDLLSAHAPGRVVAEVGAGTGVFSLAAARLGARHVYAVEPSPLHRTISALVAANGLQEQVTVVPAHIQEATPPSGGADLVFSELLNVDPFAEEVLDAMDAAAGWLAPGGRLAPSSITLRAALVADRAPADERSAALAQLQAIAARTGLELGPLHQALSAPEPYCYAAPTVSLLGPSAEVCRLELGQGRTPPEAVSLRLHADRDGVVGGVAVWWAADYGAGIMENGPSAEGHWGTLVCGQPQGRPVQAGEVLPVQVALLDGEVLATVG